MIITVVVQNIKVYCPSTNEMLWLYGWQLCVNSSVLVVVDYYKKDAYGVDIINLTDETTRSEN